MSADAGDDEVEREDPEGYRTTPKGTYKINKRKSFFRIFVQIFEQEFVSSFDKILEQRISY